MTTESTKYKNAGYNALGVFSGIFLAVVLRRALESKVPVPFWLVQAAGGAGVIAISTTQKAELATILAAVGVGHVVTGAFGAAKQFSGSSTIPTLSGMRGMRGVRRGVSGVRRPLLPENSPEENNWQLSMSGITDEDSRAFRYN